MRQTGLSSSARQFPQILSWRTICVLLVFCYAGAIYSSAQTFTTLFTFDVTHGIWPAGPLIQGLDGNFYGVTSGGARQICQNGCGTVFKITPGGSLTTLYSFTGGTDGAYPVGGLALGTNGNFYGGLEGGSQNGGTQEAGYLFEITPGGVLTNLGGPGNEIPSLLVQATDGNFFGTTSMGGSNQRGTAFELTSSGTNTTIHNFCSINNGSPSTKYTCNDGGPSLAALIQGPNGQLYGTTFQGGLSTVGCQSTCGTIFKLGYSGGYVVLYKFTQGTDGFWPAAPLVLGSDGNFYGTTEAGGLNASNCRCGTVFKITSAGALTTLHTFDRTEGLTPETALIQGTDGNFYGTTMENSAGNGGTLFQMAPDGTLTSLHSFGESSGREFPNALVQGTDGNFYGTTTGSNKFYGQFFRLSMGLAPFVRTLPIFGNVGAKVTILGTDLTGATSVTFNGTAAKFTVVSPTEITTTVPSGATAGTLQVTTPSSTLSSNVPFRVTG